MPLISEMARGASVTLPNDGAVVHLSKTPGFASGPEESAEWRFIKPVRRGAVRNPRWSGSAAAGHWGGTLLLMRQIHLPHPV